MNRLGFALVTIFAAAGAACGGKGDDCQRFWDKSAPVFAKIGGGKPMPAEAKGKFLEECRKSDKRKNDPVFRCVLDATGDEAVAACTTKAFGDYMSKSKAVEAKLNLNRLGKNLKALHADTGTFPVGKVGPTPAEPCCKGANGKCAPGPDWESNPVWQSVELSMRDPHLFQYTYESDGKTATATATGDLDCDGQMITYKLEMAIADDIATMNILEPTTPD